MNTNVIILGAGAAGLMCAIEAGRRGRSVIILDHASKDWTKDPCLRRRQMQFYESEHSS